MTTLSSIGGSAYSGYASSSTTRSERPRPPDPGQLAGDLFSKLDSSGDGSLDTDELQSMLDQLASGSSTSATTSAADLLNKLDGDGDGSVSTDEFKQALEANRPPPPPGGMPPMSTASFAKLGASSEDTDGEDEASSSATQATAASGTGSSGFDRFETSILSALVGQRYGTSASSDGSWEQQSLSLLA